MGWAAAQVGADKVGCAVLGCSRRFWHALLLHHFKTKKHASSTAKQPDRVAADQFTTSSGLRLQEAPAKVWDMMLPAVTPSSEAQVETWADDQLTCSC